MTARVFISYRSSDGTDKATALARELDPLFGPDQIFLDKDDLPAGSRWRDEIRRALDSAPILLVLVTPDYLGARDAAGRRRIERTDDPVRAELEAAVAANAHVIPLLCDGVAQTPGRAELPPPFDQLAERTWRRLRAYDWRQDVVRLAADLRQLGLVPREGAPPVRSGPLELDGGGAGRPARSVRRPLLLGGALFALGAGGFAAWRWRQQQAASLSSPWRAYIGARGAKAARDGEVLRVTFTQTDKKLTMTSQAVDVERSRDWQNHRDYWKQRHGKELKRVVYRGEGELLEADDDRPVPGIPAGPRRILLAIRIEVPDSTEPIDGGSLRASIEPDNRRMLGRLWVDSERGERFVDLQREP